MDNRLEIVKVPADVVVVGGGGAALRAAVSARQTGANVRLVSKVRLKAGGSTAHGASESMSMSAAGFGDHADSPEVHFQDTMRGGRGFVDPLLVRVLTEEAPARIKDLIGLGVPLDRVGTQFKLTRSDSNTYARALGVKGKTGHAFVDALSDELLRLGVAVDENVSLVDLVCDRNGMLTGALGYDVKKHLLVHYQAPAVILGTGGVHGVFEHHVSTAEMMGDGQAICFRHGAEMVNLEFHQVGPALVHPYVQQFSGACYRTRPKLLNAAGKEFLENYIPPTVALERVYRQKAFGFTTTNESRYVDIAISREIREGRGTPRGTVYLSYAHVPSDELYAAMPNTAHWLHERGIDPHVDKLEIAITFQCINGGVRMIDADAQSTIPGLFVIGELAGGVRGPDRPGGNSLAEGQVFGHRSGVAAAQRARRTAAGEAYSLQETIAFITKAMGGRGGGVDVVEISREARHLMQRNCMVEKEGRALSGVLEAVQRIKKEVDEGIRLSPQNLADGLSIRNVIQTSELIIRACLNRQETRSSHYRVDYPRRDDENGLQSFILHRNGDDVRIHQHKY